MQIRSVLKEDTVYTHFVCIVKKYMTERNCNEFIESLDQLFPTKTSEIVGILLGKLLIFIH